METEKKKGKLLPSPTRWACRGIHKNKVARFVLLPRERQGNIVIRNTSKKVKGGGKRVGEKVLFPQTIQRKMRTKT